MKWINENTFWEHLSMRLGKGVLAEVTARNGWATSGPGRSGAVASVYISHKLKIPFIPFGQMPDDGIKRMLIVDTTSRSGKTIRRAMKKYAAFSPKHFVVFEKGEERLRFFYEI